MRIFLLIFALLIASCDVDNSIPCKSVEIQISDANPVQFWPVDCDTYNEKEVCGIHAKCWCQPWECEDEIKTQFTDTEDIEYSLGVFNEDNDQIDLIPFVQTPLNGSAGIPSVTSSITLPALSTWMGRSISPSLYDWTPGAAPTVNLPGVALITASSEVIYANYSFIVGNTYNLTINITRVVNSGSSNPRTSRIYIMDSGFNVLFSNTHTDGAGANAVTITFTATSGSEKVGYSHDSGTNVDITINSTSGDTSTPEVPAVPTTLFYYSSEFTPSSNSPEICGQKVQLKIISESSPETELFKSDCLDIQETHKCTTLIEYSNNRNFAGLIYQDVSPEQTFQIRVPAIFFHEEFPEEDEAMELTTGIVKTSGTLKAQRLFDTDFMPYYMHRKLKLIFKHQSILIDNLYWIKEAAYEIQEGNRMWPVKKAKVFLTENYIQRAVL